MDAIIDASNAGVVCDRAVGSDVPAGAEPWRGGTPPAILATTASVLWICVKDSVPASSNVFKLWRLRAKVSFSGSLG